MKLRSRDAVSLILACLLIFSSALLFFPLPVKAAPAITTSPLLPQGQVGTPYAAALMAVGGTPPYTWSLVSGGLPLGLSLTTTGTISGTPTTAGTYTFAVQVTDAAPSSAMGTFVITIAAPALTFATTSLPGGKEASTYIANISVTGGKTPYTWSLSTGTLPSGLSLAPTTGSIAGTPVPGTAGTYTFTITVTDSSTPAVTAQQSFGIIIEKGSYQVTVTIDPSLTAGKTKVSADAVRLGDMIGGESRRIIFDLGTSHTISVDPTVQHPTESGVRFKADVDKYAVNDSSTNAYFTYYSEYYIEMKTNPARVGSLTGTGWYKKGYLLKTNAKAEVLAQDDPQTQFRFSHWQLPTGETSQSPDLSLNVDKPGSCVAHYDTFYKLTLTSPLGKAEGSAWYKAGTEAQWSVVTTQLPMSGILGFFGGKMKAINSGGNILMDGPKTVTVTWQPDYTMPAILIPLLVVVIALGIYGLYRLWPRMKARPVAPAPPYMPFPPMMPMQPLPPPPPPPPIPPPQTTVVMIGDTKPKTAVQLTREQLMEKFGELLQKYEDEISATLGASQGVELPKIKPVAHEKRLPAPEVIPPPEVVDATPIRSGTPCSFASKKQTRIVASKWTQIETKATTLPAGGKKSAEPGIAVVWTRDIFNEWEIFNCSLPAGHAGAHDGSVRVAYTQLNTITEEAVYAAGEKVVPPQPHFTDGMPLAEVSPAQAITPDQLPTETSS